MKLAVFDIDGTITRLSPRSNVCFVEAVTSITGSVDLDENWRDYTHVSDSGILDAVFARHMGRPPTAEEEHAIQQRYRAALERDWVRTRPLPGAIEFLALLGALEDWRTAIATGNWACAAEWKLDAAGLARDGMVMATANDHLERVLILRAAIQRAKGPFERVVHLGDGEWDRAAAGAAGVAFVAVGGLDGPFRLKDFTDAEAALALVESAVPS